MGESSSIPERRTEQQCGSSEKENIYMMDFFKRNGPALIGWIISLETIHPLVVFFFWEEAIGTHAHAQKMKETKASMKTFFRQLYESVHKTLLLVSGIIVVEDPGIIDFQSSSLMRYCWTQRFFTEDTKIARANMLQSVLTTLQRLQEPIVSWHDTQLYVQKLPGQSFWTCNLSLFVTSSPTPHAHTSEKVCTVE